MTKKDFEAIAIALGSAAHCEEHLKRALVVSIAWRMGAHFKRSNPRFNIERFVNAVEDAMDLEMVG